jgi:hypothetical protein
LISQGGSWAELAGSFVQLNPMKHIGKPQEPVYLVAVLLADEAAFVMPRSTSPRNTSAV